MSEPDEFDMTFHMHPLTVALAVLFGAVIWLLAIYGAVRLIESAGWLGAL